MKKIFFLILVLLSIKYCYSINVSNIYGIINSDTISDDRYSEDIESRTNILLRNLYKGYTLRITEKKKNSPIIKEISDSICIEMLNNMPSSIKLTFNKEVKKTIELMVLKRRTTISNILNLGDIYFPHIENVLDKHKLPLEIKYITIIESGLNPTVKSRSGAGGLWQFMLPTARLYGLNINGLVDERFDYVNSTEAACRLFSKLYDIYHDWWLVFAAYNCGTRYVNNAIKKAHSSNFWDIYNLLPAETKKYIPSFIATYFVVYYHERFGIYPTYSNTMYATDCYQFKKTITISDISKISGVDESIVKTLNPQFIRDIVPSGYKVRLPIEGIQKLDMMSDDQINTVKNVEINEVAVKERTSNKKDRKDKLNKSDSKYHTIKKGDTLGAIARKYNTTASKLKKMNNMKNDKLRDGQKIRVQ